MSRFALVQLHAAGLATEALRGAGAVLLDTHGARFIDELAPRDVVARAIDAQAGTVTLDLRSIDRNRFAGLIDSIGRECGLDPANTPIPVAPAAHYFIGGIVTDLDARTDMAFSQVRVQAVPASEFDVGNLQ